MRICVVHGAVTSGTGSGRYIFDLLDRFAEDGHQVTLVCHDSDEALTGRPEIEVLRVPRVSERFWRLGHLAQLWSLKRRLPGVLGNRRFDLLVGSDLLFLKPIKTLQGSSLRFIYTPLSMIAPLEIRSYGLGGFREFVGVRLYTRLQRWALVTCERVVRFTESTVRALERYYRLDLSQKKFVTVYVSREFDRGSGAAAGPSFDRPRPAELLWIGQLIKSKNVAFLLRTMSLLESTDWVLNVCSDGSDRRSLEALASSLGIADRVRFLGYVDDLAALYRRASLLLTASVDEQYSLTLLEAYAFGVPCIGLRPDWKTIFNSNEDQIIDGVTGYVIESEKEMAARIDALLADEPKRQQLARRAYAMKQGGLSFESFYADLRTIIAG